MATGSTWSVDVDGTRTLLTDVDADGPEMCNAASFVGQAGVLALGAVHGSSAVSRALSSFLEERESAPMRVAFSFSSASAALITSVEAVVFGDEEMSESPPRSIDPSSAFSAERFGRRRAW
ncbi:hypothetical protein E3O25_12070 [Cryobacterium sp. TMT1-3]|uniref:Uncharacterized protein n=1 Tax=Cryobacterium luteum TaxID=1424661 RepID=A0A5F0D1H1_9MICO|nr:MULTISPECIES: hypothetical protein [Cryobacterium]TFB86728.1 hypothetical protein E3O10_14015 [Cryobacterium luteum]TFC26104.1 hypothetical protein E3O25_12070 [Cryobacterium sp. TMT1-3]